MEKVNWEKVVVRLLLWQWGVVAAGVAIGIGGGLMLGRDLPPQVPLFYSRPWGEEQLANPQWLGLPLALAAGVAGVSSVVVRLKIERVLQALILGGGLVAEMVLVGGGLRIILLVT